LSHGCIVPKRFIIVIVVSHDVCVKERERGVLYEKNGGRKILKVKERGEKEIRKKEGGYEKKKKHRLVTVKLSFCYDQSDYI
jgi:hypothetical protein